MNIIKTGLPPVIDSKTEILIAGSLPSDISLQKQEYYGNPGNDFWRILSTVLDVEMVGISYTLRIKNLLEHKIGLWDVYASGLRKGSLDVDMQQPVMNRFDILPERYPRLSSICLNGKEAGKAAEFFNKLGYNTTILLSSSGANRRNAEERLEQWQFALELNSKS